MRLKVKILGFAIGVILLFSGLVPSGVEGVASPRSFWRKVNVNHPGQICGVAMSPSGQHIVLSGDFALYSSDGGATWNTATGAVPFILDYGDESHVFGVGTNPQSGFVGVNRSSDYGRTWELKELPQNLISFNEVDFIDSVHGWAVGNKDFIVTTNDGWQTWTTKPYGVTGFGGGGVMFLDSLRGWVCGGLVGADSAVLITTDGGVSWSGNSIGGIPSGGRTIDFVDSLHGWLLGAISYTQKIFTSFNGGQSWAERTIPVNHSLWRIEAFDSLLCWMIGDYYGPKVWKTTDGGQSWSIEYDGPGSSLLDFDMADTAHGVAVGSSGTVLIFGPPILGDLNGDLQITGADVVLELNLVYLSQSPPPPVPDEAGDVNCDGKLAPADVAIHLNRVFLLTPFPCSL